MLRALPTALLAALAVALVSADAPSPRVGLDSLVKVLTSSDDPALHRDVLRGMREALQGRRKLAAPKGWDVVFRKLSASPDPEVRLNVKVLSVFFGDPAAMAALRKTLADPKAATEDRRTSLSALLERPGPELLPLVRDLLHDKALRGPALRALAAFNDAKTPSLILDVYPSLTDAEKADALATLSSRPAYALALLDAVEGKKVPRSDVPPFLARQMLAMKDAKVKARLEKVWGTVRPAGKEKEKLLARYRGLATPELLKKADAAAGRMVFTKTCATCHTLFGEGGKIGPDLTGSQRKSPEYVLTKVLDPHAVVPRDYQVSVLTLTSGRVVSGVVKEESGKVLVVQTATEELRVPAGEVEARQQLPQSLMPEGLLQMLSDRQVTDLLAYLAGEGKRE